MKRLMTVVILMMTMATTMMANDVFSQKGIKFLEKRGYHIATDRESIGFKIKVKDDLGGNDASYYEFNNKNETKTAMELYSETCLSVAYDIITWTDGNRSFIFRDGKIIVLKMNENTISVESLGDDYVNFLENIKTAKRI